MTTDSDLAGTEAAMLTAEFSEVLGLLGHDLNSPLTALKGRLQLVQRRAQRLAGRTDASPVAPEDIERMLALVDRIGLQVAVMVDAAQLLRQAIALDPATTRLQPIIAQAIARQYLLTPDAAITFDAEDAHLTGAWDKSRISKVMMILLGNAMRYGLAGRPIVVRMRQVAEWARVDVDDEGPGVPETERIAIFQFGVHGSNTRYHAGPGLGLYVAREVVLLHGGDIGVESIPGGGSRFWFTLPLPAGGASDG
jgi:signal transduction histidine kinase